MEPVSLFSTVLGSIKSAIDILTHISGEKKKLNLTKVQGLQESLLTIQTTVLQLKHQHIEDQTKISELKSLLNSYDDWNIQKTRYELVSPFKNSAIVYALKESDSNGEIPHYLCTNCFHNRSKSILSPVIAFDQSGYVSLSCPSCMSKIDTGYRGMGEPRYVEAMKEL